ncbi:MAG: ArsR/SmtB family transcription factor [Phycisphaerales bacterium JB064]
MDAERLDRIFGALADASRRAMLEIIRDQPGALVRDVTGHFELSRIAVMRHLRVLEDAGLVTSEKVGRERRHYFNAAPIQMVRDEWMARYGSFWSERMADLKRRLEDDGQQEAARDVS